MFDDITAIEEQHLRSQFHKEMNRVLNVEKSHRPMQVYRALGVSRQTGTKYLEGQIPTKRPAELRRLLRKAVSTLQFHLTYRGEKITSERLDSVSEEYKQLELFSSDGFRFEISRKKSNRSISLELRVREA